MIQKRCFL